MEFHDELMQRLRFGLPFEIQVKMREEQWNEEFCVHLPCVCGERERVRLEAHRTSIPDILVDFNCFSIHTNSPHR